MTRQPDRPWWASEGPVDGGIDRSEDPVVRHRSARLGPRSPNDDLQGSQPAGGGRHEASPTVASRRFGGNGTRPRDRRSNDAHVAARDDAGHRRSRGHEAPVAPTVSDQPWWSRPPEDPDPGLDDPGLDDGGLDDGGLDDGGLDDGGLGDAGQAAHEDAFAADVDDGGWTLPVTSDGPEPGTGARQAGAPDSGSGGSGSTGPSAADRSGAAADRSGSSAHRPDLCGVCPICAGFRVLEDLRPELAGHLAEAAYHLAAALRSLAEHPPSTRAEGSARNEPTTMQHIDVE